MQACLCCGKVHVGLVHQKKGYDTRFKGYDTPNTKTTGFMLIQYFKCPQCMTEQFINANEEEVKKNAILLPELR